MSEITAPAKQTKKTYYYEVYQDRSGGWRWRLKAHNNKIVASSGEAFTRKSSCDRSLKNFSVQAFMAVTRYIQKPGKPVKK